MPVHLYNKSYNQTRQNKKIWWFHFTGILGNIPDKLWKPWFLKHGACKSVSLVVAKSCHLEKSLVAEFSVSNTLLGVGCPVLCQTLHHYLYTVIYVICSLFYVHSAATFAHDLCCTTVVTHNSCLTGSLWTGSFHTFYFAKTISPSVISVGKWKTENN